MILVTGAMCDRGTHRRLAQLLSAHFTVINYDRRARGESGDNSPQASLDRELEDIAALIAVAGDSAALYGISSGGALVLEAAARGLNVSGLAVYEVPYAVDEDAVERGRSYGRKVAAAVAEGRDADAATCFWGRSGCRPT